MNPLQQTIEDYRTAVLSLEAVPGTAEHTSGIALVRELLKNPYLAPPLKIFLQHKLQQLENANQPNQ